MTSVYEQIKKARRVAVPLVALTTPDQYAALAALRDHLTKLTKDTPPAMLSWDIVEGLRSENERGRDALMELLGEIPPAATADNPALALRLLKALPPRGIVVMQNAHRIIEDAPVAQAIGNLRDHFKENARMLILLAPSLTLPAQLRHDVLVLDEPLPGPDALLEIVKDQIQNVEDLLVEPETMTRAAEALRGLSAFEAEQSTALSMEPTGLAYHDLWARKVSMIEQIMGLTVQRGGETFDQIGGVPEIKAYLTRILLGRRRTRAIVFLDELDKMMEGAGSGRDTSGVSQALHGQLLTWWQDKKATGLLFVGPPGTAKSAIAKAAGNLVGIPTIAWNIGETKDSHVGASEQNMSAALKVISAVSDDAVLFIATCNKYAGLAPELRRRFKLGTVYFDLPTEEEAAAIWQIYLAKYELPDQPLPEHAGWTGAEIEQCSDLAWQLNITLMEAAKYVIPVSKSAPEVIEELRRQATGKFLSASRPGAYRPPMGEEPTKRKRAVPA